MITRKNILIVVGVIAATFFLLQVISRSSQEDSEAQKKMVQGNIDTAVDFVVGYNMKLAKTVLLTLNPNLYYPKAYEPVESQYWSPYLTRWIYQHYLKIKHTSNTRCLDIGIAYGTLATFVKILSQNKTEVDGIDFTSRYMSVDAKEILGFGIETLNIEVDDLPESISNHKYDFILLTEVIEHWNFNALPTLKKIRQLLSPTGSLFLSTPVRGKFWIPVEGQADNWKELPQPTILDKYPDKHVYIWSESELEEAITAAGMKVKNSAVNNHQHIMMEITNDV